MNVKDYQLKALHNKIGYVPQKAVLFHGTVTSNVDYGENGKKKITKENVKEAVRVAQATEFVEKMDGEYDAHIAKGVQIFLEAKNKDLPLQEPSLETLKFTFLMILSPLLIIKQIPLYERCNEFNRGSANRNRFKCR